MKTFIYICLYICLLVIGLVLPAGTYTILPGASLREAKPHRAGGQLLASRPNDQCLRTLRGTISNPVLDADVA